MKIENCKLINRGYTLIEMVVVIAVIGLALPVMFSIIFVILQQQIKIYNLQKVKRQGDTAINIISNTIRNYGNRIYSDSSNCASLTNEECNQADDSYTNSGANFCFGDRVGNEFNFYKDDNDKIASKSSIMATTVNLTNSKVEVSDFSISCSRKATFSPPIVSVSFIVTAGDATLTYRSKIKLRNY